MDLMTLGGLLLGGSAILYVVIEGKMVEFLLNAKAIILIFGGTFGAAMISFPWRTIKQIPYAIRIIFIPQRRLLAHQIIPVLVGLAEKAKREGLPSLQEEIPRLETPFLRDGIQMAVDEHDAEMIREKLERETILIRRRHQQVGSVFRFMGTSAPIFGLLGTLLGVVDVLRHITDPGKMGSAMAIAMSASFYGIFSASFFFLPCAAKLATYSEEEITQKEVIIKGVLSIQRGDLPMVVEKKLESFVSLRIRQKELGAGTRRAA